MRYVNVINIENNKPVPEPFLLTRSCNDDRCNVGGVAFIDPTRPIECCPYDSLESITHPTKRHTKRHTKR